MKSRELEKEGRYAESVNVLLDLLKDSTLYPNRNLALVYFNLSVMSEWLGRFEESLFYLQHHERVLQNHDASAVSYSNNYNGRGLVYDKLGDFDRALQYYQAGIRVIKKSDIPEEKIREQLSKLYLNLGILYVNHSRWEEALDYLERSRKIKEDNELTHLAGVYLNLARVYSETGETGKAERFFNLSLQFWVREFGPDYFQLGASHEKYGIFLMREGKFAESEYHFRKAIDIYRKNLRGNQEYVGSVYHNLGKLYCEAGDFNRAVPAFQSALIETAADFNSSEPSENPEFRIRIANASILNILISKALAFKNWGTQEKEKSEKLETLQLARSTAQLALKYYKSLINTYSGESGRLFLASDHKTLFLTGADVALQLYEITGNESFLSESYYYASAWKSAELMRNIRFSEVFDQLGERDSLIRRIGVGRRTIRNLQNQINAISELPENERNRTQDLESQLFEESRELELLTSQAKQNERYKNLFDYDLDMDLTQLQNTLGRRQVIIEYLIGSRKSGTGGKIYVFVVSSNGLQYRMLENQTNILNLANWYVDHLRHYRPGRMDQGLYDSLTHTAYALYRNLFHPIENFLAGKEIIVIPDEFLYFLPFGSLIKEIPDTGIINFASLEYLVKHYAFGISYSASLWIRNAGLKRGEMEVLAFAPNTERMEDSTVHSNTLPGSKEELKYLEEHLSGLFIKGKEVTKDTFISLVEDKEALLHIAGHANPGNKREGGYILMGEPDSEGENARLYEYEITTLDLKSDLVNLSACNTGTGVMSQGEGIFSIGRSFTQAGSPSVVFTLWDVNDERTHLIMRDFYGKLIKGEKLNHALRYSKLNYLNTSPSYLAHPYYWAGYQLAGNLSPYKSDFNFLPWAIPGVSVLSLFLLGYLILRNSRRRSDASS